MKTKNFFKHIRTAHMVFVAGLLVFAGSLTALLSLQAFSEIKASVLDAPFVINNYIDLSRVADQWGFTVTSTTGGEHNTGSAHYQGRAIDVSVKKKSEKELMDFISALRKAGIKVLDERLPPSPQAVWGGAHLHIQIGMRDCKDLSGYVETNKFSPTSSAPCEGLSVNVNTEGKTTKEIKKFIADARKWSIKVADKRKKPKNINEAWSGPYLRLQISKPKTIMSPLPPKSAVETPVSEPTPVPISTSKKYAVTITFNGTDTFNWPNDVRTATFNTTISFNKTLDDYETKNGVYVSAPFSFTCSTKNQNGSISDSLSGYKLDVTSNNKDGLRIYAFGPDYKYFQNNSCGGATIDPHNLAKNVLNDVFGTTRMATQEPTLLGNYAFNINGETVPFSGDIVTVSGVDHYIYSGSITITPVK